ncbi:hypothetical protein N2K17_26510 [Klebsiella michiganensis]|uniref:hypothetical protein n=1 Tax=Klebsiella michiganensis TaxID=1134687 RepID=UPI00224DC6E2|nr:hypothetical protein [Klebsiella michiganensis]MCX3082477.1 hypothetical protein [Klebsiella michiganensis]MCY0822562.1 hypothetical protein [Klebsiella michiganensis]
MNSDAGARARYEKRKQRRVYIYIDNIEPQSKKMPEAERDKFQEAVAEQLTTLKRATFTGDVALKIDLATTSKNAPQAHTIAKNLLDLLGVRRSNVKWPRRHLLYKDDRQIQALSVSCRHGEISPAISIGAQPFGSMLDDLELATEARRSIEMSSDYFYEQDCEADWIKTFRDLIDNETNYRRSLGDDGYDAYRKMVRWYAQRALLKSSGVTIPVLNWMYGGPKDIPTGFGQEMWASLISASKIRLQVGELPITKGSSDEFKQNVSKEITAFKNRWDWLINPLVVSVALEVIIRPNPATPPAVLHDLDNIVRDYLLPSIVPKFGTVSDHRWTIDFNELQRTNPEIAKSWGPNPMPPPGTKSGVTRYEAWRLPPVAGEPGFVSVALLADVGATGDHMDEIDKSIKTWASYSDRNDRY